MAVSRSEPTTEAEAQDLKEFLRSGAATEIETLDSFPAPQPTVLEVGRATDVPLQIDTPSLVGRLEEEGDTGNAMLELEFPPDQPADLTVLVYLNAQGEVTEEPDEGSLVGAVAFFCHGDTSNGQFVCVSPTPETLRYRFNATRALQQAGVPEGQVTANLLPVAVADREPERRQLQLTAARIELVRSVVDPG